MEYFVYQNDKPTGPLTLEELKQRKLLPGTPVWKTGLPGWVNASSMDELKDEFVQKPPAFTPQYNYTLPNPAPSTTEQVGYRIGKTLRWTGVTIILVIGIFYLINIVNRNNSYSSGIIEDPEHARPSQFLITSGTFRQNLWGDKMILNGQVANNARHTNYKDIRVKVDLLTQTNTVLKSEEFIVYEYVPYGSTKEFQIKVDRPRAAASCAIRAVSATFY